MIIIYYKHKETGAYTQAHGAGPKETMETLAPKIAKFNAEIHTAAAYAVEVADDSLEAYLFSTRNQRAKIDREAVQEAIDAIHTALDCVRSLEG